MMEVAVGNDLRMDLTIANSLESKSETLFTVAHNTFRAQDFQYMSLKSREHHITNIRVDHTTANTLPVEDMLYLYPLLSVCNLIKHFPSPK